MHGSPVRLTADFSSKTTGNRRYLEVVFKVLKEKDCHTRILYPAKLFFKTEGEIKPFSDKEKLSKFVTSRPALPKKY